MVARLSVSSRDAVCQALSLVLVANDNFADTVRRLQPPQPTRIWLVDILDSWHHTVSHLASSYARFFVLDQDVTLDGFYFPTVPVSYTALLAGNQSFAHPDHGTCGTEQLTFWTGLGKPRRIGSNAVRTH